ncbi:MAG: amidohydrolase family protein [Pirellulaceae bacterium]|nr:amidohydrolase family protein [Pirellulaceae bacterium]
MNMSFWKPWSLFAPRTKLESHKMHVRSRATRHFRGAKGDQSAAYSALAVLLIAMIPMVAFANDEIPGAPQSKPIVLVGGTVHTVSGDTIADGMVLFEKGRITGVGKGLALPANVQKIEVQGKHVYPSFLDAHTQLGLVEISSIRATIDSREVGSFNPNVESAVALNPDSELLPVARANGILLALATPTGGMISGRSSLIQLDGWTFEELVVRKDIGMHMRWPSERSLSSDDSGEKSSSTPETSKQSLHRFFEQARAYQQARAAEPEKHAIDLRFDAMLPVLDKKLPVIVEADELRQIQAAVGFALEQQIRIIIYGGYDAADCAPLLIAHQIPVIIGGTYRLPMRESDAYDASYTLPDRLRRLGVEYCIASVGKFAGTGVRNLPYHVANAAAFGLPVEDALKSITLYPAQILGVADRVGSLDTGKDATLFVCTGDPLDVDSSIEIAFVQGRRIELNDRHKRLWQKYEQKYQATGGAKRR